MSSSDKVGVRFNSSNLIHDKNSDIEIEYEEQPLSEANDDYNQFISLCNGVVASLALFQTDMQHMMTFKDEIMTEMLPPNVLLQLSLVSGKVFRSFSDLQCPLWELLRLVKVYSSPWEEKAMALKKLHDDYERKRKQLNVALRQLTTQDAENRRVAKEKRVANWEKLFTKIQMAKGHGRRWKFRMYDFRKKAEAGYENLSSYFEEARREEERLSQLAKASADAVKITSEAQQQEVKSVTDEIQQSPVPESSDHQDPIVQSLENLDDLIVQDEVDDEDEEQMEIQSATPAATIIPPVDTIDTAVWTHELEYERTLHVVLFPPRHVRAKQVTGTITFGSRKFDIEPMDVAIPAETGRRMKRVTMQQKPEGDELPVNQSFSCIIPESLDDQNAFNLSVSFDNERTDHIASLTVALQNVLNLHAPEYYTPPDEETVSAIEPTELELLKSDGEAAGVLPAVFFWSCRPLLRVLDATNNTQSVIDLVEDLTGIDLNKVTKDDLTREKIDVCVSPRPLTPQPESVPKEEFDKLNDEFSEKLRVLEQEYLTKLKLLEETLSEKTKLRDTSDRAVSAQNSLPPSRQTRSRQDVPDADRVGASDTQPQQQQQRQRRPAKKTNRSLPDWGSQLPDDFFERLELFSHLSAEHRATLVSRVRTQVANVIEQQLEELFRLSNVDGVDDSNPLDEVCIPALFMPQRSSNTVVYNPRAHQYFGTPGARNRLSQPPSMLSLPPIPDRISVLNLFDIGARNSVPSTKPTANVDIHTQLNQMKRGSVPTQKQNT